VIAGIMNAARAGVELVRSMQEEIARIHSQTDRLSRPRVFCEEWGKPLIASQMWVAELIEAAGGEFVGIPGKQLSVEEVEQAAPDVLIAAWCGAGERVPLEKIVRTRNWADIPAVTNGRVYCIRDEYLNTPAPTLLQGLRALAAAIHPDRFPQVDGLRCISTESHESSST
jgi:iron complex transport system substrate-binding protein